MAALGGEDGGSGGLLPSLAVGMSIACVGWDWEGGGGGRRPGVAVGKSSVVVADRSEAVLGGG